MDAQAIAICKALAEQRDDAVRGYGDLLAEQAGNIALKDALIEELQKQIAALEAAAKPAESSN